MIEATHTIDARDDVVVLPLKRYDKEDKIVVQVEWTNCYPSPTGTITLQKKDVDAVYYSDVIAMETTMDLTTVSEDGGYFGGTEIFEEIPYSSEDLAIKYTRGNETEGELKIYITI